MCMVCPTWNYVRLNLAKLTEHTPHLPALVTWIHLSQDAYPVAFTLLYSYLEGTYSQICVDYPFPLC